MTDDQFELEVTLNGILSRLQVKMIDENAEDLIEDAVDRIVALIAQREAELLKKFATTILEKAGANTTISALTLEKSVVRLQTLRMVIEAELERRHDDG